MSKLRFNTAKSLAAFVAESDVPRRWSTGGAYGTKGGRFARIYARSWPTWNRQAERRGDIGEGTALHG